MFSPEFFGKAPPTLFLGQVPLNTVANKREGNAWGDRAQVRVVGYHSPDGNVIEDKDLPWAIVLKPGSQGNLNRGSTGLVGGEWVVGFFLDDGGNKKNFMIIGILGKSIDEYEVTEDQAKEWKSTRFGRTYDFFGEIQPQPWQLKAGEQPPLDQEPALPSPAQFGLGPNSEAASAAAAEPEPTYTVDNLPPATFIDGSFVEDIAGFPIGRVNPDGTITLD